MICSSVNRVVFISAILQNLRTYWHYLGKAGRGQVTVSIDINDLRLHVLYETSDGIS